MSFIAAFCSLNLILLFVQISSAQTASDLSLRHLVQSLCEVNKEGTFASLCASNDNGKGVTVETFRSLFPVSVVSTEEDAIEGLFVSICYFLFYFAVIHLYIWPIPE